MIFITNATLSMSPLPNFESVELLTEYGADINNGYNEQSTNKLMTLLGYEIS